MSSDERSTCRDFERGVCNRGDKCKYFHPEGVTPSENAKLPICKDFQNRGCDRMKCKFLHITVDEEAEYNRTGTLPEHGGRTENLQGKPICKDFLNNRCDRGSRCKFMHTSEDNTMGLMYGKRYRDDFGGISGSPGIMEENEILRRQITDLQKQVIDLRQMNDSLYDQNTRYRSQLQNNPTLANTFQSNTVPNAGVAARVPPASATFMMSTMQPSYNFSPVKY